MNTRLTLIDMMKRALADGNITNNELFAAAPDPKGLAELERVAWQRLSHWADDDDIRAKDKVYADKQRRNIAEALADLEGLEAGYDPNEINRGEHQATHVPLGSFVAALALIAILYAMFTQGFFMRGD
ncbi:hypothetical protein [Sphingopyxis chilensis]